MMSYKDIVDNVKENFSKALEIICPLGYHLDFLPPKQSSQAKELAEQARDNLSKLYSELEKAGYASALELEEPGRTMFMETEINPESILVAKISIYEMLAELDGDEIKKRKHYELAAKAANKLLNSSGKFVQEYSNVPDFLTDKRFDSEGILELALPAYQELLKETSNSIKEFIYFSKTIPKGIALRHNISTN